MTKEEAIYKAKHLRKVHPSICIDAEDFWDTVIAALEQEPCDDAISRDKAIVQLSHLLSDWDDDWNVAIRKCIETVKIVPSVTPAEKVGHWEWVQYDSNPNIGNWHCSECRTIIPHMPEETDNTPIYKWCPMCGAKMASPTSCSTCILDRTDACTRGAGRAVDDEACEDYLASPTGAEGREE